MILRKLTLTAGLVVVTGPVLTSSVFAQVGPSEFDRPIQLSPDSPLASPHVKYGLPEEIPSDFEPQGPVIPNAGIPVTPPTLSDVSWIVIEKPRPRPIRINDIITVTVDDKNELIVDNRFNRSRVGQLKAELKEFIRLNGGNLDNAAANGPTIDAQLQSRLNSSGQIQASEGIKYIIAAKVVDIRPNGNLIIEATKSTSVGYDVWEYRLTGEIRPEKINRDLTAISEDIYGLKIEKEQVGKVPQSTKRPWGVVLYDWLSPF